MKPEAFVTRQPPETHVTPVWAEVMFTPGAARSGLRRIADRPSRGPREENVATVSPAGAVLRVAFTGEFATIVFRSAREMKRAGIVTAVVPVAPMLIG